MLPPIDFETYSEAGHVWDEPARKWRAPAGSPQGRKGLEVVGTANYAKHPSTEVLCLAYGLSTWQQWRPGMPPPLDLFDYLARGGLVEAWNAAFEWWIWNEVCTRRYGWPALPLERMRCAMAKSRAHALPGKLALAGEVLQLVHQKDKDGGRLLDKFSKPRNPTKADPRRRLTLDDDPADGARLLAYNAGDVVTELEASQRTPDLSPAELAHWQLDQLINRRGVAVDVEGVHACCAIVEQAVEQYDAELVTLTGCKSTELQKLIGWLHGQGVHTDSLDEENVERLLETATPGSAVHRALTIRQAVGSASVKKVFSMRLQMTAEGRLHDLYNYHGARTGRPTGEGPQPTNLPKAGPRVHRCGWLGRVPLPGGGCGRYFGGARIACPWCGTVRGPQARKPVEWNPEAARDGLEVIKWRSLQLLEQFFGDGMLTIAGCLRGLFVASPGCRLVSSDFTAIEGVVIACLAGEQWRVDVYRGTTSIYLESASRAFGVSVPHMLEYAKAHGQHHPLRDKGKRMELGLGFGGWINALRSPQIRYEGTDDELKDAILKWRRASPALVWFWGGQTKGSADSIRNDAGARVPFDRFDRTPEYFGLEGMAVLALLNPGTEHAVRRLDGTATGIAFFYVDDILHCRLPSGRCIKYHRPRLARAPQEWRGYGITYEGYNTNPKQGPVGWVTLSIYAGKFAENTTQAVARDIQMHAIANCEAAGYPVVLHTYDEVVGDTPTGHGSVEGLEARMCDVPEWAHAWPIKAAGGWEGSEYRKA